MDINLLLAITNVWKTPYFTVQSLFNRVLSITKNIKLKACVVLILQPLSGLGDSGLLTRSSRMNGTRRRYVLNMSFLLMRTFFWVGKSHMHK